MEINIISTENIKPSSPTPDHLSSFKVSLLDQLAPHFYVPLVLFYSADEFRSKNVDHIQICDQLKKSLSKILTHFYPLAGSLKGNSFVECDDEGASYVEARVNIDLSEILQNPDMNILMQFLPLNPYKVNVRDIGIGLCISHRIVDGATLATFLNAWSEASKGAIQTIIPSFDLASLFPPKDINVQMPHGVISEEKTVTKRFVFDARSLDLLKAKVGLGRGHANPSRVEAVTSLIWKTAMSVTREKLRKTSISSTLSHVVDLRGRMVQRLPEHCCGNLWQLAIASLTKDESNIDLRDLVGHVRKAIKKIDSDYIEKLQDALLEGLELRLEMVANQEVEMYRFSSWIRFPFYDIDFGFGKPIWVCTTNVPIKNIVVLMSTRSGDGIEAWVTLAEQVMAKFECHHELLEFVSST
ncbi:hypothetical protein ACB092_03G169400 [Castanea dentata]